MQVEPIERSVAHCTRQKKPRSRILPVGLVVHGGEAAFFDDAVVIGEFLLRERLRCKPRVSTFEIS